MVDINPSLSGFDGVYSHFIRWKKLLYQSQSFSLIFCFQKPTNSIMMRIRPVRRFFVTTDNVVKFVLNQTCGILTNFRLSFLQFIHQGFRFIFVKTIFIKFLTSTVSFVLTKSWAMSTKELFLARVSTAIFRISPGRRRFKSSILG